MLDSKYVKPLTDANQVALPTELVRRCGYATDYFGVHIDVYHDNSRGTLIFSKKDIDRDYLDPCGKLKVNNTTTEEFPEQTGTKVTLSSVDNRKLKDKFIEADEVVLRAHDPRKDEYDGILSVSVWTKEEYKNEFVGRDDGGHDAGDDDGSDSTRPKLSESFADLGIDK